MNYNHDRLLTAQKQHQIKIIDTQQESWCSLVNTLPCQGRTISTNQLFYTFKRILSLFCHQKVFITVYIVDTLLTQKYLLTFITYRGKLFLGDI